MEQIISNGLIEKIEEKYYIKFDLGDNYYLGEIKDNIPFPLEKAMPSPLVKVPLSNLKEAIPAVSRQVPIIEK